MQLIKNIIALTLPLLFLDIIFAYDTRYDTCERMHLKNVISHTHESVSMLHSTGASSFDRTSPDNYIQKGISSPFPAQWVRTSQILRNQPSASSKSTHCTRSHRNYPTSRLYISISFSHSFFCAFYTSLSRSHITISLLRV